MGNLTDATCRNAKPSKKDGKLGENKLTDGTGLYLVVRPSGGKLWRYNYRFQDKQRTASYGAYPDVKLIEARKRHQKVRDQLAEGIDPSAAKQAKKLSEGADSFKAVASEWFKLKMEDKSASHQARTLRTLTKDFYPRLGNHSIGTITAPQVLQVLRKMESRGSFEAAHKAKQTIGQIFRYAVAIGKAERDPTTDLRGALQTRTKKHLAAITDPSETGRLLVAIENFQGTHTVKTALQLSPLFFVRPGELRHMEWYEIHWEESIWEIPATKMKMKEPHLVPLCTQAIEYLREIEALTGRGKYVFPSARGGSRPLSENGVRTALRTMGYDNETHTPHGFRAMARTLLDEVLSYRVDWIEQQLAHAVKDVNGRAYNRTKHLPQRREMMQAWADYLDNLKAQTLAGNVITAKFGTAKLR
jgi:integrase